MTSEGVHNAGSSQSSTESPPKAGNHYADGQDESDFSRRVDGKGKGKAAATAPPLSQPLQEPQARSIEPERLETVKGAKGNGTLSGTPQKQRANAKVVEVGKSRDPQSSTSNMKGESDVDNELLAMGPAGEAHLWPSRYRISSTS